MARGSIEDTHRQLLPVCDDSGGNSMGLVIPSDDIFHKLLVPRRVMQTIMICDGWKSFNNQDALVVINVHESTVCVHKLLITVTNIGCEWFEDAHELIPAGSVFEAIHHSVSESR